MESLFYSLQTYYGMDWLSMLLGFYGTWLITERRKAGFLFLISSVFLASIVAVIASQYGFVVANIINASIALRGYRKWAQQDKSERSLL